MRIDSEESQSLVLDELMGLVRGALGGNEQNRRGNGVASLRDRCDAATGRSWMARVRKHFGVGEKPARRGSRDEIINLATCTVDYNKLRPSDKDR